MKKLIAFLALIFIFSTVTYSRDWQVDILEDGFEQTTIKLTKNNYEKIPAEDFVATLIRKKSSSKSSKAVLYIHGFVDYFFQKEMANKFVAQGFNFYALDLRRYGRSLRNGEHPNFIKDIAEYDEELKAAIDIIYQEEGNKTLLMSAHSTGGLIVPSFLAKYQDQVKVDALFLNSPFFDMNDFFLNVNENFISTALSSFGYLFPYHESPTGLSPLYVHSVHENWQGEWNFNLEWKPEDGFPVYAGWTRAILKGQQKLQKGLNLKMPVLVMYSTKSSHHRSWNDELKHTDSVLDVTDINRFADVMGDHVTEIRIEGGMHDLVLSKKDVRNKVYQELFTWLSAYMK